MTARPIVGIPACIKTIGSHAFHAAGVKYVEAVAEAAGCTPLVLPALGDRLDREQILAMVDGLLFTGSVSNVAPEHYGKTLARPDLAQDPARDATTLPLIRAAIAAGIPLLGICRGFQELNVAMGGSLHQEVHAQPGMMDHREAKDEDLDVQYGPSHTVALAPGGFLNKLLDGAAEITVNSIHGQGIERLGDGLSIEATAPDGLVEAVRVAAARSFALAVQWHPEWKVQQNPQSLAIFRAFGRACAARAGIRQPALRRVHNQMVKS
jgi:putative glutamine amidotransferase